MQVSLIAAKMSVQSKRTSRDCYTTPFNGSSVNKKRASLTKVLGLQEKSCKSMHRGVICFRFCSKMRFAHLVYVLKNF